MYKRQVVFRIDVGGVPGACVRLIHNYIVFLWLKWKISFLLRPALQMCIRDRTVPPPQDGEYTVDDLKTALEESERSLHDAVFIARQVWEKDCDDTIYW